MVRISIGLLIGGLALSFTLRSGSRGSRPAASHPPNANAQLGEVNFYTSCSAQAQPAIDRAVALLHSFQYQQAESAFTEASQRDPRCAIALWGKAMSLYHQLWDFPAADTLAKGRGDIAEAKKLDARNRTEQDYIAAAAAFYVDEPNLSQSARVDAYARAMETVYKDSSEDPNAAGFYALALINLAYYHDGLANRRKAIAILAPMFQKHPDNPGLAHYMIHATDTPELAPQGLDAARRYAKIAPDSSHALHMPSHIFTRLGLWQESINSNIAAAAAAARATEAHEADAGYQLHAMDFLNYAYLQSGQESKARQVVTDVKTVPGASADEVTSEVASLASRDALESHLWKEAASLAIPDVKPSERDSTFFARALGAARTGDPEAARVELAKLVQAVDAQRSEAKKMGYSTKTGPSIEQEEVQSWIDFAQRKTEQAVKALTSAADREDASGVDSLTMPAREMLGDMLLEAKRPKDALGAYRIVLKESPNRFDAVWGAAQAAQATGDTRAAREFYSKLAEISGPGADRPEVGEASGHLAHHAGSRR